MGVTSSQAQNITSPNGNSLAVFIDGVTGIIMLKDVNGKTEPLSNYVCGGGGTTSPFEYNANGTGIQPIKGTNNSNGNYATVGGGFINGSSGDFSTIGGGSFNNNFCVHSFIGGGYRNNSYCVYNTISGGKDNETRSNYATIGGGQFNIINPSRNYNNAYTKIGDVIGGGNCNIINTNTYCGNSKTGANTISGGYKNSVNPYQKGNTIGGGYCNKTFQDFTTISGGNNNCASGQASFIGGGFGNRSSRYFSVVGGGTNNNASGEASSILGGSGNIASNTSATIAGGVNNNVSSCYSAILVGIDNVVSGQSSVIGGGRYNVVSDRYSTIVGGCCNRIVGNFSFIGGGYRNRLGGCYNFIGAGYRNYNYGKCSFIGSGYNNAIGYTSVYSSIISGQNNSTNNLKNVHIIGSNIIASAPDTTFVQNLSKTSGTFRISHPDPAKTEFKYLQHSFVESPTAGDNIYRYEVLVKGGIAEIELPDYFKFLNENPQVWVLPKNGFGIAYGSVNEELTKVSIKANLDIEYNILIIATRKDKDAVKSWQGIEVDKDPYPNV
jgi:hypothetical protein